MRTLTPGSAKRPARTAGWSLRLFPILLLLHALGAKADALPPPALNLSGQASEAHLEQLRQAVIATLQKRDYTGGIASGRQYFDQGGTDLQVHTLLGSAYYQLHDYANAARELQYAVQGVLRQSHPPEENQLLLLRRCYQQLNDSNAEAWSLEQLVSYYPSTGYWADLLTRTQKRPDFGPRLALDVDRLRLLTGVLSQPADYLTMAQRAVEAGFPAEAQQVLDAGFDAGRLGSGPDAANQRQQRENLTRLAQEDARRIAQPGLAASEAARGGDGLALHRLGFDHVTHGDYAHGLAFMEQAQRIGILDEHKPQDAKLRLGIAYVMSGQRERAAAIFSTVGGNHGAADLARIWGIYARTALRQGTSR